MKKILFLLLAIGMVKIASAQSLLPPLEEPTFGAKGFVILKTGEIIGGKITYLNSSRGITKIGFKEDDDFKYDLRSSEISMLALETNKLTRFQYLNESASSLQRFFSTDHKAIKETPHIIYKNATLKNGKQVLLQVLNPHFDDKITVFFDPQANKTGITAINGLPVTGDLQRAYFLAKGDGPLIKVKKGNYNKVFPKLFSDCPALMQMNQVKFSDLAAHILYYNQHCN